jgi:hypothetical protein
MEYWSGGLGTRKLVYPRTIEFMQPIVLCTCRASASSSTESERMMHKITTLQFEKPPHTAFASSQHMAQKTLNSAS